MQGPTSFNITAHAKSRTDLTCRAVFNTKNTIGKKRAPTAEDRKKTLSFETIAKVQAASEKGLLTLRCLYADDKTLALLICVACTHIQNDSPAQLATFPFIALGDLENFRGSLVSPTQPARGKSAIVKVGLNYYWLALRGTPLWGEIASERLNLQWPPLALKRESTVENLQLELVQDPRPTQEDIDRDKVLLKLPVQAFLKPARTKGHHRTALYSMPAIPNPTIVETNSARKRRRSNDDHDISAEATINSDKDTSEPKEETIKSLEAVKVIKAARATLDSYRSISELKAETMKSVEAVKAEKATQKIPTTLAPVCAMQASAQHTISPIRLSTDFESELLQRTVLEDKTLYDTVQASASSKITAKEGTAYFLQPDERSVWNNLKVDFYKFVSDYEYALTQEALLGKIITLRLAAIAPFRQIPSELLIKQRQAMYPWLIFSSQVRKMMEKPQITQTSGT